MIYVDADACPVKAEAEEIATRNRVRLAFVSNGGLRPAAYARTDLALGARAAEDLADTGQVSHDGEGHG